ncbi:MAG: universal stress protein [Burkholderiales bacterium]
MFSHILVPIDGSEISMLAGRKAIALAKQVKAKLTTIMVSASYRRLSDEGYMAPVIDISRRAWEKNVADRAQVILNGLAGEAKDAGVKCISMHVFNDQPHRVIINAAKTNDCDLIVMGSHGRGGFKQLMLGSETARVLSHSKIPVLVYR